jgi:stage IV sporulation protein FB
VIEFREPPRTGFELAWSLFGIRYRVLPSFFFLAGLLSAFFVWRVVGNNIVHLAIGIVIDVACILFAVVFTEFVQGLVYRSYGLRSTVVIQEFGGGIYPEHEPPSVLQRIVVALSNPASSFLLWAIVYYSNEKYHWSETHLFADLAYFILRIISLFWGIIGLLPIFPYPSGRIMMELFTLLSPRRGLIATLVVSIVLGLAYLAYVAAVLLGNMRPLPLPGGVFLPVSIILAVFFGISTAHNWQLLQYFRAQQRPYRTDQDEYDDRAPWER